MLVRQKALLEALIEEVGVVVHNIIDSFNSPQLRLQFVIVRLKDFNLHVIHVVFDKLKHSMAQGVRLL